jgi:hypothetical protein
LKNDALLFIRFSFLLVLFLMTTSQPVNACDCAKISSGKANMHTLQTMLETFGVDHHYYPSTVIKLEHEARNSANPYWKDFVNPMTSQQGFLKSFADLKMYHLPAAQLKEQYAEILGLRFLLIDPDLQANTSGIVLYDYVSKNKYFIYGLDKQGDFIRDKGQIFTLSNS